MNERFDTGNTNARKAYIRSIVDAIEVDDTAQMFRAGPFGARRIDGVEANELLCQFD